MSFNYRYLNAKHMTSRNEKRVTIQVPEKAGCTAERHVLLLLLYASWHAYRFIVLNGSYSFTTLNVHAEGLLTSCTNSHIYDTCMPLFYL